MKDRTGEWIEFARRDLAAADSDLLIIDSIYVDTRYPAGLGILPSGFPERDDSKRIYDIAEKLYGRVINLLRSPEECTP